MSTVSNECNRSILLLESDESLAQQMALDLRDVGYATAIAADVKQALQQFKQWQPALVVVDRLRLGEAGLSFCRAVRELDSRTCLLLLMGRETVDDRFTCIDVGADDYLLVPYRTADFLDRIRFYLQPSLEASEQLRFGELVLDLAVRRVMRNGRAIDLTVKEFELLKYLMSHPCEVLTRDQILENVWGYGYMGESNVIEVYIRYLRLKIEDEGEKRLIQTVRGVGYVLRES